MCILWQVLPYKQNDGVAMGSHVASHISMKGPCLCKLRLRQRFVNDVMSIVCKGQKLNYKWKKSPQGHVYVPRLEPMAPIRLADRNHANYPSCHCTILIKRWLNDGLPARMIPSTRESSAEMFTHTLDTPNPWCG